MKPLPFNPAERKEQWNKVKLDFFPIREKEREKRKLLLLQKNTERAARPSLPEKEGGEK